MQHAHKKRKLTKLAIIYYYNNNPTDSTMVIIWFFILFLYRYELVMLQCWSTSSDKRPTFSELAVTIESMLTSMANYVDFNQFKLEVEEQKS